MSIDTTQSATPPPAATKQAASPLAERLALLYTPPAIPAVPIPELTDAEKAALAHLNEHFGDSLFALPVNKGSDEMAPLTPREMMWLSQETMLRFYTGHTRGKEYSEHHLKETVQRIESTLAWRRQMRVDDLEGSFADIEEEFGCGSLFNMGYTPNGLPAIIIIPNRNHMSNEKRNLALPFWLCERAGDLMCNGVTQAVVMMSSHGTRTGPLPPVSMSRGLITQFTHHYPETLGFSVLMNIPWWMRCVINLAMPFFDTYTRSKFRTHDGAEAIAQGDLLASDLLDECGGELEIPFDAATYKDAIFKVCLQRRDSYLQNWLALGEPKIGREERLWKVAPTRHSV